MDRPDPERVRKLFFEALDLEPGARRDFVAASAGDDLALFERVMALLRAEAAAGVAMEPREEAQVLGRALMDACNAAEPPDLVGALVGDIYRLAERLGAGTFGVVYAARDELTGADVAVKILFRWPDRLGDWLLREAGTLLLLDVPGVVHWRDHGTFEESPYVVTDLVGGEPFPGCARPASWPDVAPAAVELLATLARLHAAGVVHGDLKPANVLVDDLAGVTLLDLGSCVGPAVAGLLDEEHTLVGTLSYLAPEQIDRAPPSVQTDLYAAGVLLYESLVGEVPHARESKTEFVRSRASDPADLDRLGDLPPAARDLIERLLTGSPGERPASAADAHALLLGELPPLEVVQRRVAELAADRADDAAPIPAETLRGLFTGHDRLFHIPEDAAAVLHARTRGDPKHVTDELTTWIRSGHARVDNGGIAIDRAAIERLQSLPGVAVPRSGRSSATPPLSVVAALLAVDRHAEAMREARKAAYELFDAGRPARAAALVRTVLGATRHVHVDPADREALLRALFEAALAQADARALGLVRYELERAPDTPVVRWLHTLTQSALLAVTGHGRAALALAATLPEAPDPALQARCWTIRIFAARTGARERLDVVLAAATNWADDQTDPNTHRQAADWRGMHAYAAKRYAEAAAHLETVLELAKTRMTRLAALLKAASANLEIPNLDRAAELGIAAIELARTGRHPHFELRAERLVRAIQYRAGATSTWDRELVDAAAGVPVPREVGLLLLNEAAVSRRAGDLQTAHALGLRSADFLDRGNVRDAADLARALAFAAEPSPARAPSCADLTGILTDRSPAAAMQTLALYTEGLGKLGGDTLPPDVRAAARALADAIAPERRQQRRDVLSIDEALELLAD